MKNATMLATAPMIGVALLSLPAGAQGTSQTIDLAKVDVHNCQPAIAHPRSSAATS
jgi:hypothetical protein